MKKTRIEQRGAWRLRPISQVQRIIFLSLTHTDADRYERTNRAHTRILARGHTLIAHHRKTLVHVLLFCLLCGSAGTEPEVYNLLGSHTLKCINSILFFTSVVGTMYNYLKRSIENKKCKQQHSGYPTTVFGTAEGLVTWNRLCAPGDLPIFSSRNVTTLNNNYAAEM